MTLATLADAALQSAPAANDGSLAGWAMSTPQLAGLALAVAALAIAFIALLFAIRRPPPAPVQAAPAPDVPRAADLRIDAETRAQAAEIRAVVDETHELARLLSEHLDRQTTRLEELIDRAGARTRELERAIEAQPTAPRPAATRQNAPADPTMQRVYDLADTGLPAIEIAKRIGQHTGKVELMLALRGKGR